MLHNLTGWHALVILAIIILVFGTAKLPALAKSLGQSVRILKDETTEGRSNGTDRPDGTDQPDGTAPEPRHYEAVTDPISTDSVTTDPKPAAASARDDSARTDPTDTEQVRTRS